MKLGIINICNELLDGSALSRGLLKPLMREIIVISARRSHTRANCTEYKCFCECFEELQEGDLIPEYIATFKGEGVQFDKVKA
jgi:hypothetical protein